MKVLHLNKSIFGGSGQYAKRLSDGLSKVGINSNFISTENLELQQFDGKRYSSKNIYKGLVNRVSNDVFYTTYQFNSPNLKKYIEDADIIHLHGINGWINLHDLNLTNKNIFWTAHDMWSFTGGCVVYRGCENYKINCKNCPILKTPFKLISQKEFKIKENFWTNNNIVPIANSTWTKRKMSESKFIPKTFNPIEIVYPIVEDAFFLKGKIRNYNCKKEKITLGFAAASLTDNYKGIQTFINNFYKFFPNIIGKYTFLLAGRGKLNIPLKVDITYLGEIKGYEKLAEFYSRCDIFVSPSKMETFGMTLIEAQAVGTPVVAYNIGGTPNAVLHKQNGYLAEDSSFENLIEGIIWVQQNLTSNKNYIKKIRSWTKKRFSSNIITNSQINIYKKYL